MFKKKAKDPQLLAALQRGGTEEDWALKQVYQQHKAAILQFVLKNGGTTGEAKDLFQDAVIDFYENVKARKFKGESTIGTYLYAIARFKWLNRLKRKKTERKVIDTQAFQEVQVSFETDYLKQEQQQQVLQLFDQLGSSCKDLLTYAIYYHYSIPELMEQLAYNSEQVVRNQKYRCLKKLKQLLKEQPDLLRILKSRP